MSFKYLILLLLLNCTTLLSAQTYYVSSGASGTGSSWNDASGDLSDILNNANAGDQVWVASGTYYPIECSPCSEEQRLVFFHIPDGVAVYGGFEGFETTLNERNWVNNPTILSGDINQDNVLENNASTIVLFNRVSANTILDGFTLEHGYAHTPGGSDGEKENSGGAIFNQGGLTGSNSHPTISNCTFSSNHALGFGGAIFNNGSFNGNASPIIEHCIFMNNVSEKAGGAICNQASFSGVTAPAFRNCQFLSNHSNTGNGGAVYNQGAKEGDTSMTFSDCHFEGNSSSDYGGAVHNHGREGKSNSNFENCTFLNNEALFGGAVSSNGTLNGLSNATFVNCLFEQNHVLGDGGAVYNWGSDDGISNASLTACLFKNNQSDFAGAGMFNNGIDGTTDAFVLNCQFINNVATTYGGAIYNNGKRGSANAVITNCLFQENDGNSAGAIYNLGSENGDSSPKITNCTFYGNTANVGGAVYNNASDSTGTSNPIITNCIFWKNEANFGDVFRNILATPFIQYSVVDQVDCVSMNSGLGSNVSCGESMLYEVYPEFIDTLLGNFRLAETSPLLDIGDNLTIDTIGVDIDLDGQTRIFNDRVDLGAFEFFENYVPPFITIQPLDAIPCEGEDVLLNVMVDGTPPFTYQWFGDEGPIENATSSEIILPSVTPDDTGAYYCIVTNAIGDIIESDFAHVVVESAQVPMISIVGNAEGFCEGESAFFNTNILSGGSLPSYYWLFNGNPIGDDADDINLENLELGGELIVGLISSLNCVESASVFDTIQLEVHPILTPFIEITGPDSLVCIGDALMFEAISTHGGDNPQFLWQINGNAISGQNTNILLSDDLTQGDRISCNMITSVPCPTESLVFSNEIAIQADSCNLTSLDQVLIDDAKIRISPNPSEGQFQLYFTDLSGVFTLEIFELAGNRLQFHEIELGMSNHSATFTLLESGIYFVKISNDKELNIQKIVVQNNK